MKQNQGFTLLELMIGVVILMVALVGLLTTYVSCFDLNETMRNYTFAMNAAQRKMEEVRNHTFSDIYSYYDDCGTCVGTGHTFQISDFYPSDPPIAVGDSQGAVDVVVTEGTEADPDVLKVSIYMCWRQRSGRIIGGDDSLSPQYNSPVQLVTLLSAH
ncbi:MAG: prepilin-type N-terminal cleavage/methylation domain-containing protein [Candidatus Omnitrophota bacterium]